MTDGQLTNAIRSCRHGEGHSGYHVAMRTASGSVRNHRMTLTDEASQLKAASIDLCRE